MAKMAGLRTIGRPFTAELDVYKICKYMAKRTDDLGTKRVTIEGVDTWEVLEPGDPEREQYEASVDDMDLIDDFHEYLVLNLINGESKVFRNSYVDMFRI